MELRASTTPRVGVLLRLGEKAPGIRPQPSKVWKLSSLGPRMLCVASRHQCRAVYTGVGEGGGRGGGSAVPSLGCGEGLGGDTQE